jgi:hypothetical protein
MQAISTSAGLFAAIFGLAMSIGAVAQPISSYPSRDAMDAVTSELSGGDDAAVSQSIQQIHVWINHHHVPYYLWYKWIPALMQDGKYQEVADLSLAGILARPEVIAITELTRWRANALLELGKPQDALQAAKSNYNVCDLDHTPAAIELVGQCLAACHPGDDEIIRRFRNEQAAASSAAAEPSASQPAPTLLSVRVDAAPYKKAIRTWSARTSFKDRVEYGNLLLVADRCADAEKVFRDLYKTAATQDDLNIAVEGIARSLRAEDGNLARANTWLAALQQGGRSASTNPSP